VRTFTGDFRGTQADSAGVSQSPNGNRVAEPAQERDAEEVEHRQP